MRRAPSYVLCLLAIMICPFTGCSMDKPGGETASVSPDAKPPSGESRRFKIAGVGFQNDQFFKIIEFGMKDGAKKHSVDLSLGNSGGELDREISLIDTYVNQKMDAIVIAPFNQKASIAGLQRANDKGIKIVTYDSSIEADFPVSNIKSDQIALGRATGEEAANYIREKMGGKANTHCCS